MSEKDGSKFTATLKDNNDNIIVPKEIYSSLKKN